MNEPVFPERDENTAMAAVGKKFGRRMVEHMRTQPLRSFNEYMGLYGDEEGAAKVRAKNEEWLQRCFGNKDYAVVQAEAISRNDPVDTWGLVPSIAQIRRWAGWWKP